MIPEGNKFFYNIIEKIVPQNLLNKFSLFKKPVFSIQRLFKREILCNIFLEEEEKQRIISYYVKAKNIHNILNRFVYKYKLKKAIVYDYHCDLFGTPLEKYGESQLINIFQNNTIYKFRMTDLLNIIHESLVNCDNLFPEPKMPKNPYTNITFSKHHLYNLFYKVNNSNIITPTIFLLFYHSNFSISDFSYKNYPFLKEIIIDEFPKNSSLQKLYYEIKCMCTELKYKTGYNYINTPMKSNIKKKFIKVFSPILVTWFKSLYSPNPNIKDKSKKKISGDIIKAIKDNDFPCLKKRILQTRRDMSNNIILRTPVPPPPPPPPPSINLTNNTLEVNDDENVENVSIDIRPLLSNRTFIPPPLPELPIRNNVVRLYNSNVTSLPPLLRPLITENDQSMLIDILNDGLSEEQIFSTNDRIPRSPITNTMQNRIIRPTTNTQNTRQNTRQNITNISNNRTEHINQMSRLFTNRRNRN
tara:strand:+ start:3172 stop:4587 length:1416 start_codon:yes stop_codon:yes gene_type:complete